MAKHVFEYRGRQLRCDPMPMADGKFGAQLVVTHRDGAADVDTSFPSLGYFDTEGDAVAYAKAFGVKHVDSTA